MISKKEKIAIKIIYTEYELKKDPYKLYMETSDLLKKSKGKLTLPDLHAIILHGKSQYINFLDAMGDKVHLNPAGVAYSEDWLVRFFSLVGFGINLVASLIAAIFAVLAYFKYGT